MKNCVSHTLLLALLLIFSGLDSLSQTYEEQNYRLPPSLTSRNSMDVEAVDVDGDGDLDLFIASEYARNLLLFNDGDGNFEEDPDRIFPEMNVFDSFTGEDSEDIAVADFDLDGDLDLLFVSEDTQNHELLANDGTGLFTFTDYQFPSSTANGVALVDLNGDGYLDVIVGNSGQNQVYINDQYFSFTDETASRFPDNTEWTQDLRALDLDNDGDLDLVEGCDQGSDNV